MNEIEMAEFIVKHRSTYNHRYIERKKWDEVQLKSIDNDYKDLDNWLTNYEEKTQNCQTMEIISNKIPNNNYCIFNIWIKVGIVDFVDFYDMLINSNIKILGGNGSIITNMSMMNNLFIARLMGKELIEHNDYIEIPIILFEMLIPTGFPLYLLKFHDIEIVLNVGRFNARISKVKFDYQENESKIYTNNLLNFTVLQCVSNNYILNNESSVYNPFLINPCKMILFEFYDYEIDEPILQSIVLSICGHPIEYNIDDSIICSEFDNKKIYCLSLTHEYKTEEDMIKFFSSKRQYSMIGMNLSNVINKIIFKFDKEYYKLGVTISAIGSNQMRFMGGMFGLAYLQ